MIGLQLLLTVNDEALDTFSMIRKMKDFQSKSLLISIIVTILGRPVNKGKEAEGIHIKKEGELSLWIMSM